MVAAYFAGMANPEPIEKELQRGGLANDSFHSFGITLGYTFVKSKGNKCFRF